MLAFKENIYYAPYVEYLSIDIYILSKFQKLKAIEIVMRVIIAFYMQVVSFKLSNII